jgi:hypothetical protein
VDGWARLDAVQTWISKHHSEQTPEKYGCGRWPQVLSESRLFQLVYRDDEFGRRVAWYRPIT